MILPQRTRHSLSSVFWFCQWLCFSFASVLSPIVVVVWRRGEVNQPEAGHARNQKLSRRGKRGKAPDIAVFMTAYCLWQASLLESHLFRFIDTIWELSWKYAQNWTDRLESESLLIASWSAAIGPAFRCPVVVRLTERWLPSTFRRRSAWMTWE